MIMPPTKPPCCLLFDDGFDETVIQVRAARAYGSGDFDPPVSTGHHRPSGFASPGFLVIKLSPLPRNFTLHIESGIMHQLAPTPSALHVAAYASLSPLSPARHSRE